MTSSLRNSLHRRNHKERGQLAHRARLGILEKHSDYVKRARDYHSKQDRLTRLKQKAAERNKDEFYFSMTREKTRGGVHIKDRGDASLPTDIVKVLKTQDENYVRTMRASNLKKIDKLKTQLTTFIHLLKPCSFADAGETDNLTEQELRVLSDAGILSGRSKSPFRKKKPGHIVFVDSPQEADQITSRGKNEANSVSQPPATPVDLGWRTPKVAKSSKTATQVLADEHPGEEDTAESSTASTRRSLLKELAARLTRDHQLRSAQREFEMQRLMMGKGARKRISATLVEGGEKADEDDEDAIDAMKGKRPRARKVHDETYKPRVYKWRLERK